MKKYIVNIQGTSNIISDPMFFIGTGFMGEGFDNRDELGALLRKYATTMKDGKLYWREEIKLSFSLGKTAEAFKAEGNRQCNEYGRVNLFTAALVHKKDPFYGIDIIFRPGGWVDKDNNKFKFVVVKGDDVIPKQMELTAILNELGMDI